MREKKSMSQYTLVTHHDNAPLQVQLCCLPPQEQSLCRWSQGHTLPGARAPTEGLRTPLVPPVHTRHSTRMHRWPVPLDIPRVASKSSGHIPHTGSPDRCPGPTAKGGWSAKRPWSVGPYTTHWPCIPRASLWDPTPWQTQQRKWSSVTTESNAALHWAQTLHPSEYPE